MKYTVEEVMQYVEMEDVRFIRMAFCDVFGKLKNIAILPTELERAFRYGIAIDASAIAGFGGEVKSDLFLHPDPSTLSSLPWRSENGKVIRMFCTITYPDGTPFDSDCRAILQKAIDEAEQAGISFSFASEIEFYLFKTDENGEPTKEPYDHAGYLDVAPEDKGENVRREICITLSQMGIKPESSHHEEGPGQNEIDFRYSDPMTAADNALTFRSVVKAVASRYGLYAEFSPKPLPNEAGSGQHINISVKAPGIPNAFNQLISGIMSQICDITAFLNPCNESYQRLGSRKAPKYVSWSSENRSQLIRIPAAPAIAPRVELRSPDPEANPYLAYALLIYAGLYGIEHKLALPDSADFNFFNAPLDVLQKYQQLPSSFEQAAAIASNSEFVKANLPEAIISAYCSR